MTLLSQTVIDFLKSKKIHIKNMSNKVNTIKKVRKILNNEKSNCAFIIRQSKKRRKEQRGYLNYLKLFQQHNQNNKRNVLLFVYHPKHHTNCLVLIFYFHNNYVLHAFLKKDIDLQT